MISSLEAGLAQARRELARLEEELYLTDSFSKKDRIDKKMEALEAYISDLLAGP
jgi:predicted RNase H-like nuclease (RuvC/YqgF family)